MFKERLQAGESHGTHGGASCWSDILLHVGADDTDDHEILRGHNMKKFDDIVGILIYLSLAGVVLTLFGALVVVTAYSLIFGV